MPFPQLDVLKTILLLQVLLTKKERGINSILKVMGQYYNSLDVPHVPLVMPEP